jgi:hypothetical protein
MDRFGTQAATALIAAGVPANDLYDPCYEIRPFGETPWLFCRECNRWWGHGHTESTKHQNSLAAYYLRNAFQGGGDGHHDHGAPGQNIGAHGGHDHGAHGPQGGQALYQADDQSAYGGQAHGGQAGSADDQSAHGADGGQAGYQADDQSAHDVHGGQAGHEAEDLGAQAYHGGMELAIEMAFGKGKQKGWAKGKEKGWTKGKELGWERGWDKGKGTGFARGAQKGFEKGKGKTADGFEIVDERRTW